MHVHAVELGRKKGRFFAAGPGPDLQHDIAVVVRVLGQQKELQLVLQMFDAVLRAGHLFF